MDLSTGCGPETRGEQGVAQKPAEGRAGRWWWWCPVPRGVERLTRSQEVTCLVHASKEQLESNDGIDDDDKEHEQGDVQQGHQRLHDGIKHYVQACGNRGARLA